MRTHEHPNKEDFEREGFSEGTRPVHFETGGTGRLKAADQELK